MATWADRWDAAQQFKQQMAIRNAENDRQQYMFDLANQQRNTINDIFARNYQPAMQEPVMANLSGPMPDGSSIPPVPTGQTITHPGGINMQGAIGDMYRSGLVPQAMQIQNQQQEQQKPFQMLALEYQFKDAMQNRQYDRAKEIFDQMRTGGNGTQYGVTLEVTPQGPKVIMDPSKGAATALSIAEARDKGINLGLPGQQTNSLTYPASPTTQIPPSQGMSPAQQRELASKRAESQPKSYAALNDLLANLDRMHNQAQSLINNPGIGNATGFMAPLGMVPGTQAKGFATDLDTLKNQIALGTMQSLKSLSSTGSTGFGQLSNAEGELLKNNISNLDRARQTHDVINSIQSVSDYSLAAKKRAIQSYINEYGSTPEVEAALRDVNNAISNQTRPMAASSGSTVSGPTRGAVESGFVFMGGDPSNKDNWKPVK